MQYEWCSKCLSVFVGLYVCVLECKGSLGSGLALTDSVESMQLFLHSHKGGFLIASECKDQAFQFGQRCEDKDCPIQVFVRSSCTDASRPPCPNTLSSYDRVMQNEVPTTTVIKWWHPRH